MHTYGKYVIKDFGNVSQNLNSREGLMFRARRTNSAISGGSNNKSLALEDALTLLQQGFLKGKLPVRGTNIL